MSQANPPKKDRRFASTLARGLSVLRVFRASDDGLGNAEIAERTSLPKSTVSRLTFTLQSLGYLNKVGHRDCYQPGPALLALGNLANASMSYVSLSAPIMQKLADELGVMSVLVVRDNSKMLLVKTWRPDGRSSLWLEVGQRVPVKGTSSGHALLAALPLERFEELAQQMFDEQQLEPEQAMHIRQQATSQLHQNGFVVADPADYFTPNIHAVSVPFLPSETAEPVVFTCGAVPKDLPLSRLKKIIGPALRDSVIELEQLTGHTPKHAITGV